MGDAAKLVVRQFIAVVVNSENLTLVTEIIAPALAEEMKRHLEAVRSTYPDLIVTIGDQIAEGEIVATRVTARGTHRGHFFGLTPTNKAITTEGVNIDRVRDGKIV